MGRRKNVGRVLAGILAVGLMVSSVPSAVYAVENESGTAVVAEQEEPVSKETGEEAGQENVGTEPVGKEDNELGEGNADTADTMPEEENKGEQEESAADSEQMEGDNEAGNTADAEETETAEEAEAKAVAVEVMEADGAEASGTCGEHLTWKLEDGTLTINGIGEMYNYFDSPYCPWYRGRDEINKVIIYNGVTSIGNCAFKNCSNLTSIIIPSSVTSIGSDAFYQCKSLDNISIPDSVTSIGICAFGTCSSLTNITIPSSVTSIGEDAFSACKSLTSITILDSVTSIGKSAFTGCSNLTEVHISSVENWCKIGFLDYNSNPLCNGGNLYVNGNLIEDLIIPDGMTSISEYAFDGCSSLKSITIPDSVTSIGAYAFEYCKNLTGITIPDDSVTSIGHGAFWGCNSLTDVTIPNGVTSIGHGAFAYCRSMRSIVIPDSVTQIADRAFDTCDSLERVYISRIDSWCGITFDYYSSNPLYNHANLYVNGNLVEDLIIPDGVTEIKKYAFRGCSSLKSITLSDSVTSIGSEAFRGCFSLKSITLSDNVTNIGSDAFMYCSSLQSIIIPSGMTYISYGVFEYCNSLTSITIPGSVTSISSAVFSGCISLSDIYYGGSESDWLSITIGDYNEPLTTATIHYNSAGSGTGDKPKPPVNPPVISSNTAVRKREIPFYPWYSDEKTISMDWGWDLILKGNSAEYDNRLARIALALSGAAEHSQSSVEELLKIKLETETDLILSRNYDLDWYTPGYPGVTFGHRTVLKDNGEKEHIIVMVVRGTTNAVDIRTDLSVAGFSLSAANLSKQLEEYIYGCSLNTGEITRDNVKFLITGHSLGGVVANKVARGLNESYGIENVYAYTFAAPLSANVTDNYSYNIHNILNVEDMIPNLTNDFSSCRYGNDWWFYRDASPKMYSTFVDNFGLSLGTCIKKHKILGHHAVETYMAYLLTGDDIVWKQISAGKASVCCPVDVKVYNSAGELVGSVTDNRVDEETLEEGVVIFTGGADNDEKYIYFLKDDTYSLELTATDSGTMQYTMQYVNRNTDEILQEKSFRNVVLTDGKEMTSSVSVWDKTDPDISVDDKIDTPQVQLLVLDEDGNAVKEVLPDGNGTEVPYTDSGDVLPEDIPTDGKIPDDLWIAGVKESYTYTGTAIKPEIRVYDGKTRLQSGKDYTASYKNNIKVNNASKISTAPTITVKGKGNYAGSETATFQITAVDLSDSVVLTEDITVAYNKKIQKKVPVVTYNGKKLAANRDFTVSYPNGGDGAYKEAGTYDILLTAKSGGNFSGSRTVKCTITENTLLSKVSVKKIQSQVYTGEAIEPELTVTFKGAALVKDTDYSVSYTDNTEIGTAKAILTGIGKYAGTKSVTFSITGTSLRAATVSGIENRTYNGNDQEQCFTVTLKGRTLTEGTDYDVSYEKNKNTGKASITIKGKGAYMGTIKKTFTIGKYNVAANADGRFEVKLKQDAVPYAKGGAKPGVTVRFKTGNGTWDTLAEGQDYTLSYRNHTAVNDGSKPNKQPVVTVQGKGNFSGKYGTAPTYQIVVQDMGRLTLTAQDKTYQNKKNVYATKITITDLDGKVLKPGMDYNKVLTYSYANDTPVNKNDIIPAGTILKVKAEAKSGGNYAGTLTGEYRMTQAAISSASVSVPKQIYTGRAITLKKDQITVKIKGRQLAESQYEIVPNSYKNNIKKGTATVTIRGLDNYGGTKDIRFTINAKGFLWWWR